MNYYSITLFLHIVGALGFFVALGLEWTSLRYLRNAKTANEVSLWMGIYNGTFRLGIASMLTILASGIYMMATGWGGVAWIIVALVAFVLVIVLSMILTRPRMAQMRRAMAVEKGLISPTLQTLAKHRLLQISIQTRMAIALGIVYLMTLKPDLEGSMLTMAIAIVLGLALSQPVPSGELVQEGSSE